MHLCQCVTPVRIYNKYSKEFCYVPCGKCDACRNAHSAYWTQRLTLERKCWKYCLFVTLTYAPEHLPVFVNSEDGKYFCGSPRCFNPNEAPPIFKMDDLYLKDNSSNEFVERNNRWIDSVLSNGGFIPHLSRYHAQLFIKRLRKNLQKYAIENGSKDVRKDALCRYWITGEYGESTFRPHMHCLFFFNSELEKTFIQQAIYTSWKYGLTDSSFVSGNNASYVASYVNSISHLPLILRHASVRPFFLCSKVPTIGSLFIPAQEIREIFDSCSPTFILPTNDGKAFIDVPLWRSFKDCLYPKLALFSKFSGHDRIKLYRAVQRFEEFSGKEANVASFVGYMRYCITNGVQNRFFLTLYRDYILAFYSFGFDSTKLDDFLIRWYYVSNRVFYQSTVLGIDVSDYVSHIERFYRNCEEKQLKDYFHWQEKYSEEYGSESLIGCDLEFLRSMINLDRGDVTAEEIRLLESYGIDCEKFFSPDLSVRYGYIERLLPERQKDFLGWYEKSRCDARNRLKNKRKNDYLEKMNNPLLRALADF